MRSISHYYHANPWIPWVPLLQRVGHRGLVHKHTLKPPQLNAHAYTQTQHTLESTGNTKSFQLNRFFPCVDVSGLLMGLIHLSIRVILTQDSSLSSVRRNHPSSLIRPAILQMCRTAALLLWQLLLLSGMNLGDICTPLPHTNTHTHDRP